MIKKNLTIKEFGLLISGDGIRHAQRTTIKKDKITDRGNLFLHGVCKFMSSIAPDMYIVYEEHFMYTSDTGTFKRSSGVLFANFSFSGFTVTGPQGAVLSRYATSAYMTEKFKAINYDKIKKEILAIGSDSSL